MKQRTSRLFQIGTGLFCLSMMFTNATTKKSRVLSSVVEETRIEHARELLGQKYYGRSPINFTVGYAQINRFILDETRFSLPKKYEKKAFQIAQAIINEANKSQLDPLFVLAVIKHESTFNPDAIGGVGELGLMQVRPETGAWLAKKFKVKWQGKSSLKDPKKNIEIGVKYLAYLREMFGHGRLYLSAYNMGPRKVRMKIAEKYWPKEYSSGVMKKYLELNKALATKVSIERAAGTMIAWNDSFDYYSNP